MPYSVVTFGTVPDNSEVTQPLDIRVRESQAIRPRMIAYIWQANQDNTGGRTITWAISRSMIHRSQPPSAVDMFEGGPVFFGLFVQRQQNLTSVGTQLRIGRHEVDLRGIQVAGDLTVCLSWIGGNPTIAKAEFFYEVVEVGKVAKAAMVWRTETKEQPN